jgi:hypothetical protein
MKSRRKKSNCQRFATISCLIFAIFSNIAMAESSEDEALGYSIKGDRESPNVLYFVPWKSPSPPSKISIPPPELNSMEVLDRETLLREQLYFKQLQGQSKHTH